MVSIGWFLGDNMDRALGVARGVGYAGLGLFTVFILIAFLAARRLSARRKRAALSTDDVAENNDEVT
jgi:hypothetical protein